MDDIVSPDTQLKSVVKEWSIFEVCPDHRQHRGAHPSDARLFAESLSQLGDLARERILGDESLFPDGVEELTFFREMLIRNLAPVLVAMRARQGMAIMLRLNRVIDKGIAVAVVGYTDALVATLFAQNGVPVFITDYDTIEVERQLDAIELELSRTKKSAR